MKSCARVGGVTLVALSALTGPTACRSEKLPGEEVAADVRKRALAPRGITGARVVCPAESETEKDAEIRCSVTDAERNRGAVSATVLDEDGRLGRYKADVAKLQVAVIEKNAAEAGSSKGISGDVDCPATATPKTGAVHLCAAEIRGSGIGLVRVMQTDAASNVQVEVQRRRLRTAQIERNISRAVRKQGINAQVRCPARVPSQKGKTFECKVRNPANGRELTIVATQKDDEGNFDLETK